MSLRGLAMTRPDNPLWACTYGVTSHPLYHRCKGCRDIELCEYGQTTQLLNYFKTGDKSHLHCKLFFDHIKNPGEEDFCQNFCSTKKTCSAFKVLHGISPV